ncbi:Serine/arginine-rich splicing factor 2 [Myotis brandtii]|uniref:Serine/arginine-rich splicing factor 2 n=1 Tax=Myotis brandtii TaxID=109478 RepID=S7PMR6_MYOBR|nr:PREDICTED: serine/arginine-rich splicing factor 2 [Myotis brandtii]EPQ09617.1 Serine/arginine-rich splicing factor 2 [Myotis brandtii]
MSYPCPPLNVFDMTSVKVDNLNPCTTTNSLRVIFQKYGEIGDVYIPRDRFTKKRRGFAFVRFLNKRHAEDAIAALDEIMVDGHVLRVHMARYSRLPDIHYGSHGENPPHSYECRSRSPMGQSQFQSQGTYLYSYEKSPSRFPGASPSTSESTSTSCFKPNFSWTSGSSSLTTFRLGSRILPEEKSRSPPKNPFKSLGEEGAAPY